LSTATVIVTARASGVQHLYQDWRARAACAGLDNQLFYGTLTEQAQALRVCRRCPVTAACLDAAMAEERCESYRFGVRGGTLPAQRHRMARVAA
jgi:WhiB family redox-sensing transcriptional regulator